MIKIFSKEKILEFQIIISTSGNANPTEPTRKHGQPRRVLFEEPVEPEIPNQGENPIPRQEEPEPEPEPRPRNRNRPPRRNPPQNEPTAEQFFNLLRQALNRDEPQQRQRAEEESEDKMLTRFLRFNPPSFDGEPDDLKSESWLSAVEKTFQILNYTDA